jgi:cephalosporin hydroxylase
MEIQQKLKEKLMSEIKKFNNEKIENIRKQNSKLQLGIDFINNTVDTQYTYNFSWLGRPIIQYPQDMVVLQEIIWEVKPDLIIETGIAHGGSLIFTASMLTLLEACGEIENGQVLGIDIDIREHNKKAIEAHPMSKKITMFQGSSIDDDMVIKVKEFAKQGKKILVILDSNHTHDHVLTELRAYADLASVNSYCIVFDTVVEDMPENSFPDRPWGKGDNPKTAVWEFLKENNDFVIDKDIENKVLITVAPDGYLKRVK